MQRIEFVETLKEHGIYPLRSSGIRTMQVNVGCRCNMACRHCHVQAGPSRDETMGLDTVRTVLEILRHSGIDTLDITGGEPALNPHLRYLIHEARAIGCRVMVRTNLTIFCEKGMEDLADFYWANDVELIASLPCYLRENVDAIRGSGAFDKCIKAMKVLNSLGFGIEGRMKLNLVYNPNGAFLPPDQSLLEEDYHRELRSRYGVYFNRLYAFTNVPLGRFGHLLTETGQMEHYTRELKDSFNPATLESIMCRHLISIGWDGSLYDCDFNQVAGLKVRDKYPQTVSGFDLSVLAGREVAFGDHCYACTAGQGST